LSIDEPEDGPATQRHVRPVDLFTDRHTLAVDKTYGNNNAERVCMRAK